MSFKSVHKEYVKNNKYIPTEDLKYVSSRFLFIIDILFMQRSSLIEFIQLKSQPAPPFGLN